MVNSSADIGIFGGSGLYSFLGKSKEIMVSTPYGKPSAKITLGNWKGRKVAFLPRHGKDHSIPPHLIPYKANIYAFKELGVKRIIAPTASGSLKPKLKPGHLVLVSQFVDRTKSRKDTFYEGVNTKNQFYKHKVVHVSAADPYCAELTSIAQKVGSKEKINLHTDETVVVIEGPRFSTRSESMIYQKYGCGVINMTQYPEVVLARELGMCYLNVSLITDYDSGLKGSPRVRPVSATEVMSLFSKNIDLLKKYIFKIVENIPKEFTCSCSKSLENAVLS